MIPIASHIAGILFPGYPCIHSGYGIVSSDALFQHLHSILIGQKIYSPDESSLLNINIFILRLPGIGSN